MVGVENLVPFYWAWLTKFDLNICQHFILIHDNKMIIYIDFLYIYNIFLTNSSNLDHLLVYQELLCIKICSFRYIRNYGSWNLGEFKLKFVIFMYLDNPKSIRYDGYICPYWECGKAKSGFGAGVTNSNFLSCSKWFLINI